MSLRSVQKSDGSFRRNELLSLRMFQHPWWLPQTPTIKVYRCHPWPWKKIFILV